MTVKPFGTARICDETALPALQHRHVVPHAGRAVAPILNIRRIPFNRQKESAYEPSVAPERRHLPDRS
ncbi:hypothetical protein, partial [Cronobacter sakazakii]|uniref:hypothetical protein n=1 Tax=Cronobacter sakazakii TaxID=28141 RepID=UPI001F261BF3